MNLLFSQQNMVRQGSNLNQKTFTRKFAELAQTRRVDMISIGDSNQLFGGHGWDQGWGLALINKFDWYGSTLFGACENNGAGSGHGSDGTNINNYISKYTDAGKRLPTGLEDYVLGDALSTYHQPVYVESGTTTHDLGFQFSTKHFKKQQVLAKQKLRQSFQIAFIPDSTGSMKYGCRLNSSPYTTFINGPVISNNGILRLEWINKITDNWTTLDFNNANYVIASGPSPAGANATIGPFSFLYQDVDFPNIVAGLRHSTFVGKGAQPTKYVASQILAATDLSLKNYLQSIVRLQDGEKIILIRICEGLNDRNDNTNSVGPNPALGNTKEGFADNTIAIIDRLVAMWVAIGNNAKNIGFLVTPSHTVEANDSSLLFCRQGAEIVKQLRSNVVTVNLAELVPESVMLSGGGTGSTFYQNNFTDRNHLQLAGYEYIANIEANYVFGL